MFFKKKPIESNEDGGKVIAFLNQKGGVGKTTMCFNTAFALSQRGHSVLCIDLDPQSNLTLLFDQFDNNETNIHHLLVNSVRELRSLHTGALVDDVIKEGQVDLIPSGQELSGFDLTMASISSPRQLVLRRFLEKNSLKERYDYILIDCPPTLGLLVVNTVCASDGVIVPFRPDDFSKKGLEHFYEMLEDVQDMGIGSAPKVLAHVPNLMDNRRRQEENDLEEIKELLKSLGSEDTIITPFYNRAQLVKSQSQRKSVFDYASKEYAPLHQQFSEIADKIEAH